MTANVLQGFAGRAAGIVGSWCVGVALAGAQQEGAPVEVATVERAEVFVELGVSGTVVARHSAEISAAASGLVDEVLFEIGDRVSEGDPLVRLDSELDGMTLRALRAGVQEAEARRDEARRRVAEAERMAANSNIAETELRERRSAVEQAEAALVRAQAETARQAALIDRYEVLAPFDGVISTRAAERGEWVDPGDALLTLVDVTDPWLVFEVPQDAFHRLGEDSQLRVRVDAEGERHYSARIRAIIPVSDPSLRTFRVRATLEDAPALAPGMSARGTLRLGTGETGVLVSRDALNRYPEGRITVWEVIEEEDGPRVRERRVRIGERFGDQVVIREGLDGGETVVVSGNNTVDEGQRVAVR